MIQSRRLTTACNQCEAAVTLMLDPGASGVCPAWLTLIVSRHARTCYEIRKSEAAATGSSGRALHSSQVPRHPDAEESESNQIYSFGWAVVHTTGWPEGLLSGL